MNTMRHVISIFGMFIFVMGCGGHERPYRDYLSRSVGRADSNVIVSTKVHDPMQYGAIPSDGVDDTSAIQAAIDAAGTSGTVELPPGTFNISSSLSIRAALTLRGAGYGSTKLVLSSPTQNGLTVLTTDAVSIQDLSITAPPDTQTAGDMISLSAEPGAPGWIVGENTMSSISNVRFENSWNAVHGVRASNWRLTNFAMVGVRNSGIICENQNQIDSGDVVISSGSIYANTTGSPQNGIQWLSGGGLKVIGVKINNTFTGGFRSGINIDNRIKGGATSVFLLQGNSIENFINYGIMVAATASQSSLAHIVINGNQIAVYHGTTPTAISAWTTGGGAMRDVLIANNSMTLETTSHPNIGINIGAGVSHFVVERNTINSADTGIYLSTKAVGLVGNNLATYVGKTKYGEGDEAVVIHDLQGIIFDALPPAANGSQIYCLDCTLSNPCASGGTGAIAKYLNGAKVCN